MEEKLNQINSTCIKIVFFGPESTGKSTLSDALAKHYKTACVPEYARDFLQRKWDMFGKTCEKQDLWPIAKGQIALENKISKEANRVLFCDTDLLQTKVYSEVYYSGYCDPRIEKGAKKNHYDLYFLCDVDIPWVADDLRDKPHERKLMFKAFENELQKQNCKYVVIKGDFRQRFNTAIHHVNALLGKFESMT